MKHNSVNLLVRVIFLAPLGMAAHADVHIGIGVVPPPLYYGPPPVYYTPPPPVYYGPGVVYGERGWNYGGEDDGRWRGRGWGHEGDRGWAHDQWHGEHGGDGRGEWHHH